MNLLDMPSWVYLLAAAAVGLAISVAVMRATVRSLKDDVSQLRTMVATVASLQAEHRAVAARMERVERELDAIRGSVQQLALQMAQANGLGAKDLQ